MPSLSVFGAQWGDEGKGKIIDLLARDADLVVRYQGGPNAGHTVVVGDQTYVLRLIPSGILNRGTLNIVANGVALDPLRLFEEIDELRARRVPVEPENLRVSAGAHVIFEHHRKLDQLAERWRGAGRIGTTGRGIGPCYADKTARTGLRVCDLLDADSCKRRLSAALVEKNALFEKVHGEAPLPVEEAVARYVAIGERLAPFVCDTGGLVRKAYAAGKRVLFEGAQGALLDLDHGTYPYVTSSSTGTGGIAAGSGFPAAKLERAIGIAKAYCTRVGEGPFPSEDFGRDGEIIREVGHEYGSVTGRPRRCGWFDAVAMRYTLDFNGATSWIATNLDVLSAFDQIKICTSYQQGTRRYAEYPSDLPSLEGLGPIHETMPGWRDDITGVRRYRDLPAKARSYVERLEALVGVRTEMLSVGPERDQVIPRDS
ncbi:MAG: adenylosuccinate synthase [Planctomycetes bacterium]|nr:adenylosuccinate synthase [Planctomycetota bacterium]